LGHDPGPRTRLGSVIMDCSKLSESKIVEALRENSKAIANIRNRHATPAHLQFPPLFRIALTEADDAVLAKIKQDNRELEAELVARPRNHLKVPPQSK
jgi:hypothetical protein